MWQVYGQDHILKQLGPALKQGRLAHAYLLVGPPRVGKMALAINLAQGLNCQEGPGEPCGACNQCVRIARGLHADVRVIGIARSQENRPTRTVIGIDDVKDALHQAHLKPYEGAFTVIIFDGAEFLSEEASNALLKTLEEPPPQVIILLLAANEEALLSTVLSRCRSLHLLPVPKEQIKERLTADHNADPESAERVARLARGCLGWAITALAEPQLLEERDAELEQLQEVWAGGLEGRFSYASDLASRFSRDREAARQSLYLWLRWWRDLLLIKEGAEAYVHHQDHLPALLHQAGQLSTRQIAQFIKNVLEALEGLDSNASPRLCLEVLMLRLPAGRT